MDYDQIGSRAARFAPGADGTAVAGPASTRIRVARLVFATQLALIFALALWFRVSSLGAFPWHSGDESYYGVQTAHWLQGKAFATRTPNQSVLNPFLVALQAPFHLVARPAVWVLRAPGVICGVLAVVLTYVGGARTLDRTTALIAALLLATLPSAIYNSRLGLEQSQLPLFALLVLGFAIRGHGPGLLVSFLASMLVHPSAIFLMPIALTIYLVRLFGAGRSEAAGDPARRRWTLIVSLLVALVVVVAGSLVIFNHPLAQLYLKQRPRLHWVHFLDGYEQSLFYLYPPISKAALGVHRWSFRGLVLALLVFGTRGLVRARQWERLALIAGLVLSLSVFHFVAGPNMLRVMGYSRYGVVFALPTCLAFACLLRASVPTATPQQANCRRAYRIPLTVALVLGWALLLSAKLLIFDRYMAHGRESIWTFQPDAKDEFERTLSLIRRDHARPRARASQDRARLPGSRPEPPVAIVADDYWIRLPLEYLASTNRNVQVTTLISDEELGNRSPADLSRETERALRTRLRAGGYLVARCGVPPAWGGSVIEDIFRAGFPAEQIQRWEVLNRDGHPAVLVYRRRDDPISHAARRSTSTGGVPAVRR
jgi:hypothetical protein